MIQLTTNVLGVFALKDGRIIEKTFFPEDAEAIAERMLATEEGICAEEELMIKKLHATGISELYVRDRDRFTGRGLDVSFLEDRRPPGVMRVAEELGLDKREILVRIKHVNAEVTKKKLQVLEKDQILMQAVSSLDDIEEVSNRLLERLREWYSLHFPELDYMVKRGDLYAGIITGGDAAASDAGLAAEIGRAKEDSLGMPFTEEDLAAVRRLSKLVADAESFRSETESYIGKLMGEIAPNTSALAGPLLGARLISMAGGLERLSRMPASTIQILGAEESFFRFLKTKKRPPKHGVIFQLPEIRSAANNVRGKVSRKFAAKLAICAKSDYFKGEYVGEKIREDFISEVERLRRYKPRKG